MKWVGLLVGFLIWPGLMAQGGRFESEASVTFGQGVVFTLTAVTDEPVTAVTLTMYPTNAAPQIETLMPSQLADGRWQVHYVLEPQVAGLSPFSTITYDWLVSTAGGETIAVPAQMVIYQDDRFAWKRIEAPVADTAVSLFWPGESDEPGRVAFAMVQQTAARLQTVLPLPPDTPLPIFLYPSTADLRSALRLNGHDWVQGHTDPALGVVLVTAVNGKTAADDLRQSLPHEVAHSWLYLAAGSHYAQMPAWFKEGWAIWAEGGEVATLASPLPLLDLCQAEMPNPPEVGAAQSGSLVWFVEERYGRAALVDLAMAFVSGADCDTAVRSALGQSAGEFEAAWLAAQQPQPTAVRFLQQNGIWLLLLLGGFALMGLLLVRPARR